MRLALALVLLAACSSSPLDTETDPSAEPLAVARPIPIRARVVAQTIEPVSGSCGLAIPVGKQCVCALDCPAPADPCHARTCASAAGTCGVEQQPPGFVCGLADGGQPPTCSVLGVCQ